MISVEKDIHSDILFSSISDSVSEYTGDSVFKQIFKNNHAIMLIVEPYENQSILDANEAACNFYGYSHEQIIKLKMGDINTLPLIERQKKMKETIGKPQSDLNFIHKTSSGVLKDVKVTASSISIKNKKVMFIIVHDITELKSKEFKLQKLLSQTKADTETKEILLREINHRVKNNLSSLIGILYAEKNKSKNTLEKKQTDLLNNLINRVKGISIAHDLLSRSEWKPISIGLLSEKIINSLKHLIPSDRYIKTEISQSSVLIDAEQSQSMAVIINELFVNSLEHASHPGGSLKIEIKIVEEEGSVSYKYKDNGPGFSKEVLALESFNVGLYLIKNIVEQSLRGKITLKNENGALVEIKFPGGGVLAEI